jgi:type IV fimbrial biogenesis protein FimT
MVELMIAIVIVGILTGLAMPSFVTMMRNAEIRNAAESVANGMQRARAEGVARNSNMEFVLGAATAWSVDYPAGIKPVAADPPLDQRSGSEGSANVTRTVTPADATTITFNNLGGIVANADASATLTQVDFASVGGNQALRVTLGAGGNARMCDPHLAVTTPPNPRAC